MVSKLFFRLLFVVLALLPDPIIINMLGIILDGHHRFRACRELGFTPKHYVMEFIDTLEEKQFVMEFNLRRQLSLFQSENGLYLRRYGKRDCKEKDVAWWS